MIDFEAVFCDVDDFCQVFLPSWQRQLLIRSERCRQCACRLTLSEILTILIALITYAILANYAAQAILVGFGEHGQRQTISG